MRKHIEAGVDPAQTIKVMVKEYYVEVEKEKDVLTYAMENAVNAMVEAAKKGDKVAVRRQLEAGVEVTRKQVWETGSDTPRSCRRLNGHLPIVKLLHGKGANVNAESDGFTLYVAALHGHLNTVKYLWRKLEPTRTRRETEGPAEWAGAKPPDGLRLPRPGRARKEECWKMNTAKHCTSSRRATKGESMMEQDKGKDLMSNRAIRSGRPTRSTSRITAAASSSLRPQRHNAFLMAATRRMRMPSG